MTQKVTMRTPLNVSWPRMSQSARTKAVLAEYRQWLFCQGEEIRLLRDDATSADVRGLKPG